MFERDDDNDEERQAQINGDLGIDADIDIVEDDEDLDIDGSKGAGKRKAEEQDEKVSPAVQKRLDSMTYKMREAERREAAANERFSKVQSRLDAMEDATVRTSRDTFRSDYTATRGVLKQAIEDGDTDAQLAAMEKLTDLRAKAHNMAADDEAAEKGKGARASKGEAPVMSEEAVKWLDTAPWFEAEGYEQQTSMARNIDRQLALKGIDQNDPRYFEELDKKLQKFFPDLYNGEDGDDEDEDEDEPRKKPKNNAAPGNRQGKGGKHKGRYTLTKTQLAMAGELGLTTKVELEEYAKECATQAKRV
mgnify:CR=1 FL=1